MPTTLTQPLTHPRYRVVPRADVVEWLVLQCWPYEARAGMAAPRADAERTLDELHRFGLPREARYDPFEVLNFVKIAGRAGACDAWDASMRSGRRMISELGGIGARAADTREFEVRFAREVETRGLTRTRPLRVRVPAPLVAATQQAHVEVAVPPGLDARIDSSVEGRIEVTIAAASIPDRPVRVETTIAVRAAREAHALGAAGDVEHELREDAHRLYTRGREGLIVVSAAVAAAAAEIAGRAVGDVDVLRRLAQHVAALESGCVHYDALDRADPLGSVLATRWVDCQLATALLVALCRARGIPARMVSGYGLYAVAPFFHYWAEVHLRHHGWVPVDFLCADIARWRGGEAFQDVFFGSLDYRLKVECLPRTFVGNVGVPLPRDWYTLKSLRGDGVELRVCSVDRGAVLYRDAFSVLPAPG
jgi:transglutaminase superfamily protein